MAILAQYADINYLQRSYLYRSHQIDIKNLQRRNHPL